MATNAATTIVRVVVLTACLCAATVPAAERMDGWRGPFNNGYYPAHDLPARVDMGDNLRWAIPMPSITIAEPVVMGKRVITLADPDQVIACDIESGEVVWQTSLGVFEQVGRQKGYRPDEIARDREIYRRAYALEYIRNYGDGYSWRKGDRQLEDAVKLARHLYQAVPGMDAGSIPALPEWRARHGDKNDRVGDAILKLANPVWKALGDRYGQRFGTSWMTLITRVPATPVTDGERVYVAMAQGQVACLAGDGRVLWFHDAVPRAGSFKGSRARYVPSPLLAEGKVVWTGGYHVMALDAATGLVLWDHDEDIVGDGYLCGSPVYLRAGAAVGELLYGAPKPTGTGIIVTAPGRVYRLSDGKRLFDKLPGDVRMAGSERGGNSPLPFAADSVCFQTGNNSGGPNVGLRFVLDGKGEVTVETLWNVKRSSTYSASGAWNPAAGTVIQFNHGTRNDGILAIDGRDGREAHRYGVNNYGWPSPAVADGKIYLVRTSDSAPRGEPKVEGIEATVFGLEAKATLFTAKLRDGIPPERLGFLVDVAPQVFSPAVDPGEQEPGFHPYGNRLFLRTKGALLCWGKPGTSYEPPRR